MNKNILFHFALVLILVLSRFIPHPPNMTAITAIALAGSVYVNLKTGVFVPLAAMIISDIFLGFHPILLFVYLSFFLIALIGMYLKTHKSVKNVVAATLLSSVLFFIVTNFGVWMSGTLYTTDIYGLQQCYIMAIPFFRNTLIGDFLYTAAVFSAFELSTQNIKQTA